MKRMSKEIRELLQKSHRKPGVFEKLIGKHDIQLGVFDEIASANEPLAVPWLTIFLLDDQVAVREAAARTIGRLIANLRPGELLQMDNSFRNHWSYESYSLSGWVRLKPPTVKDFWRLPHATPVVGITSFHGSGFVREMAVNELAAVFDGTELPFLLIRLNDWIEAVRDAAASAVWQRIQPEYAAFFLKNLPLVLRLRKCGRARQEKIVAGVTALLQEPAVAPILREGMMSNDRWLRRESFKVAVGAKTEQAKALLKERLTDADPIMRLWAVRNVLARLDDAELFPILSGLARDQFMPVRCEILNLFVQRFPKEAPDRLIVAFWDNSSSVRAIARFWIKTQNPEFNFAEAYRSSLKDSLGKRLPAAIAGLGETGKTIDAEVVLPFAEFPSVGVRKAAIHALAALDGDRFVFLFMTALKSEQAGISNEGTRALAGHNGSTPGAF